jgi:hypothetical protein
MREGQETFECNECGETHAFGEAVAVNRGGSANLVCRDCRAANGFELL